MSTTPLDPASLVKRLRERKREYAYDGQHTRVYRDRYANDIEREADDRIEQLERNLAGDTSRELPTTQSTPRTAEDAAAVCEAKAKHVEENAEALKAYGGDFAVDEGRARKLAAMFLREVADSLRGYPSLEPLRQMAEKAQDERIEALERELAEAQKERDHAIGATQQKKSQAAAWVAVWDAIVHTRAKALSSADNGETCAVKAVHELHTRALAAEAALSSATEALAEAHAAQTQALGIAVINKQEAEKQHARAESATEAKQALIEEVIGWAHDGRLQTFEDRERFRKWARALKEPS